MFYSWKCFYPRRFFKKPLLARIWTTLPKFQSWGIWLAQNHFIFQAKNPESRRVAKRARKLLDEAKKSNGKRALQDVVYFSLKRDGYNLSFLPHRAQFRSSPLDYQGRLNGRLDQGRMSSPIGRALECNTYSSLMEHRNVILGWQVLGGSFSILK